MARSLLSHIRRDLYTVQRTIGDGQAITRGKGVQRYARRVERRRLLGWLFRNTRL